MRITRATNTAIRYACLNFHYAKAVPVNPIGYNIYNDNDEWCGVILYARGACPQIGKPYGLIQGQVLELVRVALNGKQEHTTQAVALSLKQLKKDYPIIRLIVSYADTEQKHLGTIYQATNWIYTGKATEGDTMFYLIRGKKVHNKTLNDMLVRRGLKIGLENIRKYIDPNAEPLKAGGKFKYLMPMDKKMKKQIAPLAKPYPKNEDWVKIDRKAFKMNNDTTAPVRAVESNKNE